MSGQQSSSASAVTVLIMAGGTGGHVFPALATAEWLRTHGARVEWLGAVRGMESRIVAQAGLPFHAVPVRALRGKGWLGWLLAPLRIARALASAARVLARVRPSVVLGMGGYVSGPGGVAARIARTPLVIHEQNAIPGLTNRLLSRVADRVLEGFPGSFAAAARAQHTGNPVRATIAALAEPARRLAGREGHARRLLVLGGSQGARTLNEVVPAALGLLAPDLVVQVRHQCGTRNVDDARAAYARQGLDVTPRPFIEDMAESYAWADLVICRAGAITVAELAAVGVASILVPFPFAVDDHQTANARVLERAGAAVLLPQSELEPGRLARLLAELCAAPARLLDMALAARRIAIPDADARVAACCLEVARA